MVQKSHPVMCICVLWLKYGWLGPKCPILPSNWVTLTFSKMLKIRECTSNTFADMNEPASTSYKELPSANLVTKYLHPSKTNFTPW